MSSDRRQHPSIASHSTAAAAVRAI